MTAQPLIRATCAAALALLAVTAGATAQDASDTTASRVYTSSAGGFSVAFPPGFSEPTEIDESEGGVEEGGRVVMAKKSGNLATVFYDTYPHARFETAAAQQLLAQSRDDMVRFFNGRLQREEPLSGGRTGRTVYFTAEGDGGTTGYGRADMLMHDPGFYQVIYIAPTEAELSSSEVEHYFRSFTILPPRPEELFVSNEGKFSIQFPSGLEPERAVETAHTPVGDVEVSTLVAADERSVALMSFGTYPDAMFRNGDAAALVALRDTLMATMLPVNGRLVAESDRTVDGFPAHQVEFAADGPDDTPAYGRALIVVARPRVYQILLASDSKKQLDGVEARRYFDSFTINGSEDEQ